MSNQKAENQESRRNFLVSGTLIGAAGAVVALSCKNTNQNTNLTTELEESSMLLDKKVIATDKAALPVGPYSQGIRAGNLVFVAGEKGIDPKTNQIVPGGIGAETKQTLENIRIILEAGNSSLEEVVSSVVYLTDITTFAEMNKVYDQYFSKDYPVRTTVGVMALPAGASVEITVIAVSNNT